MCTNPFSKIICYCLWTNHIFWIGNNEECTKWKIELIRIYWVSDEITDITNSAYCQQRLARREYHFTWLVQCQCRVQRAGSNVEECWNQIAGDTKPCSQQLWRASYRYNKHTSVLSFTHIVYLIMSPVCLISTTLGMYEEGMYSSVHS